MRQILKIKIALVLGVLGGIFVSVVTSPTTAVTHTETDLMAIHGLQVRGPNHGLQVRVPNDMKIFPVELISTALIAQLFRHTAWHLAEGVAISARSDRAEQFQDAFRSHRSPARDLRAISPAPCRSRYEPSRICEVSGQTPEDHQQMGARKNPGSGTNRSAAARAWEAPEEENRRRGTHW